MVDKAIATGEIHRHEVTAAEGRYVELTIEPVTVDVQCGTETTVCPGCTERTPCATDFTRRLMLLTKSAGNECIDLVAQGAPPYGHYRLGIVQRPATADDARRLDAQRALVEGIALIKKEDGAAALVPLLYANDVFREIGDCRGEADATYAIAVAHALRGDNQEGIRWFEAAIPLQHELGDNGAEASSLRELGRFWKVLREYDKSRDYLTRSLAMFEKVDDPGAELMLHDHLGECELYAGRQYIAIAHFERALALANETGIRDREPVYHNNIGVSYASVGDWKKSLQALERSAAFLEDGDRAELANSLTNIGAMHAWLGAHEEALAVFERALVLARELRDPRKEAVAQMNSGASLTVLGQLDRAQAALDAAVALLPNIDDPRVDAMVYRHRGRLQAVRGNHRAALASHERSLVYAQIANNRRGETYALLNVGTQYLRLGDPARAREIYERVLAASCELEDRGLEAAVRMSRARLARDEGRLREAWSEVDAALPILEELRRNVAGSHLRTSYLASLRDDYETAIDVLMALGEHGRALETSERARGRGLLDVLMEGEVEVRQGIDGRLLDSEAALHRKLNEQAAQRSRLQGAKRKALEAEIAATLLELRRIEREIRTTNPRYAALTQPSPPSLRQIQRELLDADTVLIEIALGDTRSYIWAVTRERIVAHELPKRKEIEALARKVHEATSRRDGTFLRDGARLREMLLGKIALKKRLLFVVEGALQYVPFAALPGEEKTRNSAESYSSHQSYSSYRPLIADHEIVSIPSITALAALRADLRDRKPAPRAIAVLADPVFSAQDSRIAAAVRTADGPRLARLPLTRDEAASILRLVPRHEARAALDFDANRRAVTGSALRDYRYIHFATHGVLDSTHPELSGVVLSLVDRQGRPQDGFLRLHDVYNLELPAELVVLSACQTALGKDVKAEGLVGLTRGFMYAGAARVVSSLWKIDDRSTAELMKRFYEGMLGEEKLTPAAALRAAQIEMWRSARRNHPYHWAAFTLQGEWR